MLHHLELKNFKKHKQLVVDFTQGLNGIVGPNYVGKSTLLNGIMFCLGGSRMVPGKRLHHRDSVGAFEQTLVFSIPGRGLYRVVRGKSSAHLQEAPEGSTWAAAAGQELDWPKVASGTTPVNNAIARLLGMPLRRFAQIKYARQKKVEALLQAGSTELFKIISELTGIEKVTSALEELSKLSSAQRRVVEATPWEDAEPLQREVAEVNNSINTDTMKLAEVETRKEQVEQRQRDLEAEVARFQAVEEQKDRLERVLARTLTAYAEASEAVTKAATAEAAAHRALPKPAEVVAWRAQQLELTQQKAVHDQQQATASRLQRDLAAVKPAPDREPLQAALKEAQASKALLSGATFLSTQREIEDLSGKIAACEQQIEDLSAVAESGVCPTCGTVLAEGHDPEHVAKELASARQRLPLLMRERAELRAALAADELARSSVQKRQQALDQQEAAAAEQQRLRDTLQKQLDELPPIVVKDHTAELKQISEQLEAAELHLRRHVTAERELDKAKAEETAAKLARDQALEQKDEIWKQCETLGVAPAELADRRADKQLAAEKVASEARQDRLQTRELGEQLAGHRQRLSGLQQQLAVRLDRNERHAAAEARLTRLEELTRYIRDNRDRYTKQVWDLFTASASMFVSNVTGGAISDLVRSEDGEFSFHEGGFEMTIEEASGAQGSIMGLAVQMALADAAPTPLDVLLLDEISADCDAEHSAAAMALLAASGKQVVAVTHRELDSSLFANTIQLERKE